VTVVKTAQLFVTCLVDGLHPDVGRATVRILERLGYTVEFPRDQTCCGQPAFNSGFGSESRAMVAHTIRVLDATTGPIVIPSGSCAAMLAKHAVPLVEGDPELAAAARRVASRTFELTAFLAEQSEPTPAGRVAPCVGTYHHCCHGLRELGIEQQPLDLLNEVEGLELVPLVDADDCCGFGGLFSIEMPDVSAAILRTKLRHIQETSADTVIAGDVSCLMHIAGGLHRIGSPIEVRHVAEVLAGDS
jgi:L-lactate dehydrogenase complex protein LldE